MLKFSPVRVCKNVPVRLTRDETTYNEAAPQKIFFVFDKLPAYQNFKKLSGRRTPDTYCCFTNLYVKKLFRVGSTEQNPSHYERGCGFFLCLRTLKKLPVFPGCQNLVVSVFIVEIISSVASRKPHSKMIFYF